MTAGMTAGATAGALAERTGWPPAFAEGAENREAAFLLLHLLGLGAKDLLAAGAEAGTASAALDRVRSGALGSDRDRRFLRSANPAALATALEACRGRLVLVGDAEYPAGLADLEHPPLGLFVRGRPLDGLRPGVAIVGSRGATPYGREVAEELGRGLGAAGAVVVSGAARGIDAAAHLGALGVEGRTVAVLGCGIERAYPASSRPLLDRIEAAGSVVSEYPPGVPAEPFRFPVRNRIIAAMARTVVVVEGAPRSGSQHTVKEAVACGREVMAVPGPVTAPLSAFPNELIRSGVALVRDAADVLFELGLGEGAFAVVGPDLPRELARVLEAIGGPPQTPELVASGAGVDLSDALMALLDLEMRGLVRRTGGRYERTLLAGR